LQFLEAHDGDEHDANQNVITIITNMILILILMIFTYSRSDSKINTRYVRKQCQQKLNGNLIKPNINCHSQCEDQIHYYKHECFN
jgi:hypothetical protein